jgi:ABC-type branched-subunit amino acid transport system ATPase component
MIAHAESAESAAAVESTPRLRAERVSKRFGGVRVLDGVSVEVAPGEVVGLIGPNGSGKTTLLNCIAGVLRRNGGRIYIDEKDVTRTPTHRLARLGMFYSFQRTRLLPELSVAEHVVMVLGSRQVLPSVVSRGWSHSTSTSAVDEVLDRFLLGHVRAQPAGSLSFGQRQLLCLALAMAGDARIVLLDEPLAGLSGESITRIGDKVTELASAGVSVVIVEHRLRSLASLCSRFIVMHEGAVIAEGAPAQVLDEPHVVEAYFGTGRQFGRV